MRVANWKRVLATGEAGFLGPHPCERLLNGGCDVLCLDNFFSGTEGNVAHLFGNSLSGVMRRDVTFPLFVEVDEGFVKTIDHFRRFPAL